MNLAASLTLDRARSAERMATLPSDWDVSNFGLPRCQIFDCFSISPLSRLLFRFLHSNLDCCGVLFSLCNKIRFPEVSYLKKLF